MTEITHRVVRSASGLDMHVAEAGDGPLVLLLHGFPECWYSWRHQLTALAAAGYHAVAPDQRGYARTGGPADVAAYSLLHLAGDAVGLIGALGADTAVVAGHDWGAPVAWAAAQFRPDLVRGVVGLSVPHYPRPSRPPLEALRAIAGDGFYMLRFQEPGVADAEFAKDREATFRRVLWALSGDAAPFVPIIPEGKGFIDVCPEPETLPSWFTADDVRVFAGEYAGTGFTGPLNWYRNLDRNWELTAAWTDAPITPPALFVAGDRDMVVTAPGALQAIERMRRDVPALREPILLPGCGHWTQQERPAEVSAAMIDFIGSL